MTDREADALFERFEAEDDRQDGRCAGYLTIVIAALATLVATLGVIAIAGAGT